MHRAFSSAVHRHRAFSCAQSFPLCTELSVVHRASFWQPLQPWFVKETAVFLCKGTKAAKSAAFCDCTPEFYGGILFLLLEKQGKLYFLQSSQTSRERGNQRFRCVGFPSPLNPHPFLTPTRGAPLDPLCYASLFGTGNLYPNSAQAEFGSFGLRRLVSWGFLGAKAGRPDRAAGEWRDLAGFCKVGLSLFTITIMFCSHL